VKNLKPSMDNTWTACGPTYEVAGVSLIAALEYGTGTVEWTMEFE